MIFCFVTAGLLTHLTKKCGISEESYKKINFATVQQLFGTRISIGMIRMNFLVEILKACEQSFFSYKKIVRGTATEAALPCGS